MMADKRPLGQTQSFVLARGLKQVGELSALIGHVGNLRFFQELTADPDRPEVRPDLAYREILSSMQPGWTLRLLRFSWPDPEPRRVFQAQMARWERPTDEGLSILYEGLAMFVEGASLPFVRRTVLEFAVPNVGLSEALAWWESVPHILIGYGVHAALLDGPSILELVAWLLNPRLE